MQKTIEQTKNYKSLRKANPTLDEKLLRESAEFRRGLLEGYKRGYEKGFKSGFEHRNADIFNSITDFLQIKLKELEFEGKTLSEAIEILNK